MPTVGAHTRHLIAAGATAYAPSPSKRAVLLRNMASSCATSTPPSGGT
jgi:hypothetical protein